MFCLIERITVSLVEKIGIGPSMLQIGKSGRLRKERLQVRGKAKSRLIRFFGVTVAMDE